MIIYTFRFYSPSRKWSDTQIEEINAAIQNNVSEQGPTEHHMVLQHVPNLSSTTRKQKFELFSTISNFHWIDYDKIVTRKTKDTTTRSRHSSHMLYYLEGHSCYRYIPTSPRYLLLYFLSSDYDYTKVTKSLIESLLEKDAQYENAPVEEPPAKKMKWQQATHIVRINSTVLWHDVGEDLNEKFNFTQNVSRSLYDNFKEELILLGCIAWCYHSDETDVCIMNDVVPTTGVLSPNAFVHVMKTADYSGQDIIKCTCSIFDFIRCAAHNDNPHWPFADTYPDVEMSSPHCHSYNEFLQDGFEIRSNNTLEELNIPLRMVKKSLGYLNEQVLLLGNVTPASTMKFSVKEQNGESYSCVHVTFTHGKCMLTCSDGMCKARMHNKKRVPQSASIKDTEHLCTHLHTISINFNAVKKYFPDYFCADQQPECSI